MQKSLLIDSDVLIDHLRKEKNAFDFFATEIENGSLLFVSVISRIEIFAGMRSGEEVAVSNLLVALSSGDLRKALHLCMSCIKTVVVIGESNL
ncbi:MAG: PINc protein, partial [Candidatus Brocadiaceae bacterium]|nr:PINc protein [Candidatus Brocadiaceae bacterium]